MSETDALLAAIFADPIAKPKRPPQRLPVPLKPSEIDALCTVARDEASFASTPTKRLAAWRDFVMVQTGTLAGPRIAELCALEVPDADLAAGMLAIKLGKNSKDRNVPIGAKLAIVLREWIGARTSGWLFPGPKGKRLATRTFEYRLDTLARKAGLGKEIHPHQMRHAFATALLKKGVNLKVISRLLGHASVATTQIYAGVDIDDLRDAVELL